MGGLDLVYVVCCYVWCPLCWVMGLGALFAAWHSMEFFPFPCLHSGSFWVPEMGLVRGLREGWYGRIWDYGMGYIVAVGCI